MKIIKISSCQECPFCRVTIGYKLNYCIKSYRSLDVINPSNGDSTIIQDWCELEDAENGEDKDRVD
jgi:hypothetical protein